MKKIVTLVLMIVMLFSISAFAEEEFTLHNGTQFGMSREEVISVEQNHGFFAETDASKMTSDILRADGTFAGRENGRMYYTFDTAGNLVQFHYCFEDGDLNDYYSMNNSLIAKYGAPNYSSETNNVFAVDLKWYPIQTEETPIIWNGYSPITGKSLDNTRMKAFLFDLFGTRLYNYQDYTCSQYAQWLLRNKDGSAILIDHSYIHCSAFQSEAPVSKKSNLSESDYDMIIYTYFSPNEMESFDSSSAQAMDDL